VTARLSSEKGSVKVWWEDPQGNKIMGKLEPGGESTLQGSAKLDTSDEGSFTVHFEAQGEGDNKQAENVRAEIKYD